MLLALINGLLVFSWAILLGGASYHLLGQPKGGQSLLMWTLLGWATQSILASGISLFFALDPDWMALLWSGLSMVAGWRWQKEFAAVFRSTMTTWRRAGWVEWVLVAIILMVGLSMAARPGKVFDEGLYYTQFIRWTQEFGVVPGLGNLHTRLGFNSHWHVLQASVAWPGDYQHDLNAQLWILISLVSIAHLMRWRKRKNAPLSCYWLLLLLLSPLWFNFLTAPSADFPVAVLTWIIVWLYLSRASAKLLVIFTLWGITIKLSAGLLFFFPMLVWHQNGSKHFFHMLGLTILTLGPWIARHLILSGYIIYPGPFPTDWDWHVPIDLAMADLDAITTWARLPGGDQYWLTIDQPWSVWVPNWWPLQVPEQQVGIALSLVLGLIGLGLFIFKSIKKQAQPRWITSILFLSFSWLFWLEAAPDPRFGLGAIWGILLVWGTLGRPFSRPKLKQAFLVLLFASSLMMCRNIEKGLRHPIGAAPFFQPLTESISISGGEILQSRDGRGCFDAKLPCVHVMPEGIEFRGKDLKEGFRIKSHSP